MEIFPQQWDQVKDLYEAALACDPSQREEFLRISATDSTIREEVRRLLAEHDNLGDFLSTTVLGQYVLPDKPPTQRFLPGQLLARRFRIIRFIAAGGMGEVYEAEDLTLEETLAIKTIRPGFLQHTSALERFKREVHLARQVTHPNVCRVFDLFSHRAIEDHAETVFVSMELLLGETLAERIHREGRFATMEALPLISQIAAGLDAAHRAGIVHGDLKPGNVILVRESQTKEIRCVITDFGLAIPAEVNATIDPDATVARGLIGTPAYMAPEQIQGGEPTRRSDIYALGLVMYEMVTAEHAFPADTPLGSAVKRLSEEVVSPKERAPDLPSMWDQAIMRCLERDQSERFSSALDVATALSYGGVKAESLISRVRRPPVYITGLLLLITLGFGVVLSLSRWWYWKQRPSERSEIHQRQLTARTSDNPVLSAVVSRDGKYLACSDKNGISIQEVDTGEEHRLPGTAGLTVNDWYPDGLRLLVTDDKGNLSILFTFTGEKRTLATGVFNPSLSPDGSQIAFFREIAPRELWVMQTSQREPKVQFAIDRNETFLSNAAWSPDGKTIAYIRGLNNTNILGILETRNLENGETRDLLTDVALADGCCDNVYWIAGGRILYGDRNDLWELSVNSSGSAVGKPIRITNTTGLGMNSLSASADGKRLAILFSHGSKSLFIANLSNIGEKLEHPRRLTNDYWDSFANCWTADGQTLFYSVVRNDQGRTKSSIYKRRVSSDAAELFLNGPESYTATSLSPDGKWLIVITNFRGPADRRLLRVPVSGGPPELISELRGISLAQCARTGSGVCVLSEVLGEQDVFTFFDPVHGRQGEITRIKPTGVYWSLSPDGSKIALVENLGDSVRVLDLSSIEIHAMNLVPPPKRLQLPAWSADGKQIFVSGVADDGGALLEIDPSGRTHRLLNNSVGWIGNPRPSPDGKHIAYTYEVGESNVTLLENF